jgi:hypothetical protein
MFMIDVICVVCYQCYQSAKRSRSVFRKRSVGSVIFKKSSEAKRLYIYINLYILRLYSKKYVERQISCRIYENMHICTSI